MTTVADGTSKETTTTAAEGVEATTTTMATTDGTPTAEAEPAIETPQPTEVGFGRLVIARGDYPGRICGRHLQRLLVI